MGWVFNAKPRSLYPPGRDPVPTIQEAGWASGLVCTGAEKIAPTVIRSLDLPARRVSLYRLSYPGPLILQHNIIILTIVLQLPTVFITVTASVF